PVVEAISRAQHASQKRSLPVGDVDAYLLHQSGGKEPPEEAAIGWRRPRTSCARSTAGSAASLSFRRDTIAETNAGGVNQMFGTVARYVDKPGHEKQLMDEMGSFEDNPPSGWLYHTVFRSSKDPNESWLTVVF